MQMEVGEGTELYDTAAALHLDTLGVTSAAGVVQQTRDILAALVSFARVHPGVGHDLLDVSQAAVWTKHLRFSLTRVVESCADSAGCVVHVDASRAPVAVFFREGDDA